SCGAKEFFDTEGVVGLLAWLEGIESVLHISKCPAESQVEFTTYILPKEVVDGRLLQLEEQRKPSCIRAFAIAANEAHQDLNVKTSTFSWNDHFVAVIFNFDADFSFISTKFLPLIHAKPNIINLGNEIEIANDVKVETNKIVRGCRIELEGHTFIIDLISFRHGSFEVIVGMDWLSKRRAKIVCFEKIVQILLSNGEILKFMENVLKGT
ncbi:putative reverse transcriptase domain-containing protein, partial [Tanacetum coccineum]